MTGYDGIQYAINNSRTILAHYNQEGNAGRYHDVLIEKVSHEISGKIKAPRALVLTKLFSALSIALQHLVDVQTSDGRIIPVPGFYISLLKTGERKSVVEKKLFCR